MFRSICEEIIKSNIYLTLGTTNGKRSWVAPLYYCYGKDGCFYFSSQKSSRHIKDLTFTSNVSFAIFDNHVEEGKGNGVQGSGTVQHLCGRSLIKALSIYHTTYVELSVKEFTEGPYRLYRLKPHTIYVLDPTKHVDTRARVL